MPKYTDDQVERARNTDLERFLRSRGEKLIPSGPEYRWVYRDGAGAHDSVTVRGGEWFDHKREIGGDAIGFLQEFMDMDFREAVAKLLDLPYEAPKPRDIMLRNNCSVRDSTPFVLPPKTLNMHRMYAYLTQTRLLSTNVVTHFVQAGSLYEDAKFHNAVFLGCDDLGTARAATLKGTLTIGPGFRQTLTGSDTRYGFHNKGVSKKLFVFEAPIDMLSYISTHQQNWQRHSYIALDGLSSKAIHHFLSRNPQLVGVCLCLDNDAAGIEAAGKFRDELTANGYTDVTRLASEQKDWNEDIKARRGLPAIPAQKHPKIEAYQQTEALIRSHYTDTYAEYAKQHDIAAINNIRRELSRMGDDPAAWEPHLLRTAALCVMAARHLGGRMSLSELADGYKPYTDKGKLKAHIAEIQECLSALCRSKGYHEFIALADACIRTQVYIQTDYTADLARREVFTQNHDPPVMEMTING